MALSLEDAIGQVFRHKRLFNYVIAPISIEDGLINCLAGKGIEQQIPMDYFKRDWKIDTTIELETLLIKMEELPMETPFTTLYTSHFEKDDNNEHSYLHFDATDDISLPAWKVTRCSKSNRDSQINPFTMIMPVLDEKYDEVVKEVELINIVRSENNFMSMQDFTGFEYGLIKLLELKYLREI